MVRSPSDKLVESLQNRIDSGHWSFGECLPGTKSLATEFGMSYPTAHKALCRLVKKGYIRRKKGEGTFVAKRIVEARQAAVLVMRTEGDLFGPMAHEVLNVLQSRGLQIQVIPLTVSGGKCLKMDTRMAIQSAVSSDPLVVIAETMINDSDYIALIQRIADSGVKVIWLPPYAPPDGSAGNVVEQDKVMGFMMAMSHLVELGHEHIGFIARAKWLKPYDPICRTVERFKNEKDSSIKTSMIPIAIGHGAQFWDETKNYIKKFLQTSERPTAIIGDMDFWAKLSIDVAIEMGLKVPEDLSVIGYYDTHWAQAHAYDMTSINIQYKSIGKAVEQILRINAEQIVENQRVHIMVNPILVRRSSTASNKKIV